MILPDVESKEITSDVDELDGSLSGSNSEDKLMHTIVSVNKDIDSGDLVNEMINNNLSSFKVDLTFKNLVSNYESAKKLYGETIIRQLTGFGDSELSRNMKIPEFQRELKERIKRSIKNLKQDDILSDDGTLTKRSIELAKLSMLLDLDKLKSKSLFGEISREHQDAYGVNDAVSDYKKHHNYKDIAIKQSIKQAVRRGHSSIDLLDLKIHTKRSKKNSAIIYAIDASGSMQGNKIKLSKQAGLGLAYHAIENKDSVGLVIFSGDVQKTISPTSNFDELLDALVNVRASGKTDFVRALKISEELLQHHKETKHIVLITDALATAGKNPEEETLDEILRLKHLDISVSIIGINLNEDGISLGEKISDISGKFYLVDSNKDDLNEIILEDYYNL